MKRIDAVCHAPLFLIHLVALIIAVSIIAGPAEAMFVPAAPQNPATPASERAADLAKIQRALESKTIEQRLMDYGLSPEEALMKVNSLSDDQIHLFAAKIDALQAGGMSSDKIIIILLIVVIIVILIA